MVLRAYELIVRIGEIITNFLLAIYRDIYGIYLIKKADGELKRIQEQRGNVHRLFRQNVITQPDKACIVFEGQIWTFRMVRSTSKKLLNDR